VHGRSVRIQKRPGALSRLRKVCFAFPRTSVGESGSRVKVLTSHTKDLTDLDPYLPLFDDANLRSR
jgi:hypothetical protein